MSLLWRTTAAAARMVPLSDVPGSNLEACRVCRPPQFGRLASSGTG